MKTPLQLAALAVVLAVSGCIKDPHPPVPEPSTNPGWLIVKWVQLDVYEQFFPDPEGPPNTISKRESRIHYNAHYKPFAQEVYASAVNDTANLQLIQVDSFFYDASHRMVEARKYSGSAPTLQSVIKFSFNGNDTIPSASSYLTTYNGAESTTRYVYLADEVLAIGENEKTGGDDTTRYIFENGNYMRYVNSLGEFEDYLNYKSAPNPRLRFNVPHGNVITMPMLHGDVIRLSRNHHGERMWRDEIVGDPVRNAQGLVAEVGFINPYTIGSKYHVVRYEYDDDVLK